MVPSAGSAPRVVSWERSSSGRLRAVLAHLGAGFFVAVVLAVFALVVSLASDAVTDGGSADFLVVLLTLLFVGGPFSLLYLVAARGAGDLRDLLPYDPGLRPKYVLLAAPFSAALFVGVFSLPYGALLFVLCAVLLQAVVSARDAAGELSVDDGSVRVLSGPKPRSHDVRKLRSHASWTVGSTRVVRLRYAGSLSFSRPSLLFVPESEFPAVESALSEIASRDYGLDPSETSRAAKAALAAFGLLFFALAGVVAFAVDGSEATLMVGPAAIVGMFGVVFWAAAWAA